MGRSRGITLKGAAAGAFIRAQMGLTPEGDSERALRVATLVHMHMKIAMNEKVMHLGIELGLYHLATRAPCGALLTSPDPSLVHRHTHDAAKVTCPDCLHVTEAFAKVYNRARRLKMWPSVGIKNKVAQ